MRNRHSSQGFVLVFSLVVALCIGVILAGTLGYVSNAARRSAVAAVRSSCRLAAMSAIEKVKQDVYQAFARRTGNKSVLGVHVYDWFTTGWSATGLGSDNFRVDFETSMVPLRTLLTDFTELRVRLRSAPVNDGNHALVTFFATATRDTVNGIPVTVTLAEQVAFGVDRSKVFDYAYFVNNYGWFEGSTITANGAVRANGDMSLSQNPKVNGDVYAAVNTELGVPGDIKNGQGTMDTKNTYRSSQYGVNNRARPLMKSAHDGGYDAPDTVNGTALSKRLHPNQSEGIDMPWISGLNEYIAYGKELKSTLSQGGTYYINNANAGDPNYGYYQGTGPSGNPNMPDNHALVLEGTQSNPIRLNGPVVVSNDVVIKGYVTGQGTIYSSRNIHIVGNIKYINPPNWANKTAPEGNSNSTKDMLCLAAKGNIVMGNCTDSKWLDNTLKTVLSSKPYVQPYACAKADDGTWIDGDIGYPKAGKTKFEGNYLSDDGGRKVTEKAVYRQSGGGGWWGGGQQVLDHYEYTSSSGRRYYDSVVPPNVIASKAETITQIDAVLYNNHGVFGRLGGCTINGSLVCRNEGMIFTDKLYLNWDYRLYSGSPENVMNKLVGMPLGTGKPIVQFWQEVPNDWNADVSHD